MEWLHAFDVNLARSGQNPQFAGGRLRVRGTGLLKGEPHPTALLHLAAKITAREKDAPKQIVSVPAPKVATHA